MNAEILVFVICVEAIIYLLLYNLHDCTLKLFSSCKFFPFRKLSSYSFSTREHFKLITFDFYVNIF